MNIKRSYFQLLLGSVTVGLFLANCTLQQSKDDGSCDKGDKQNGCDCADHSSGYQVCKSDGTFGACVCPDANSSGGSSNDGTAGKTNSTAGKTDSEGGATTTPAGGKTGTAGTAAAYAGAGDGGAAPIVDPAAGGAGGEGPVFVVTDPNDCEACLAVLCDDELDTCLADNTCGYQYTSIIGCVDDVRQTMLAKRDAVRGCGVNVGSSPNASLQAVWAPAQLSPLATDLLNCMATSSSKPKNADWANDLTTNFPNNMPAPWPADSCAKLSCTSKFQ